MKICATEGQFVNVWMRASLQRPLADEVLKIVAHEPDKEDVASAA
jgi:hypothetical protein